MTRRLILATAVALVVAACGGDSGTATTTTDGPDTTIASTSTTAFTGSGDTTTTAPVLETSFFAIATAVVDLPAAADYTDFAMLQADPAVASVTVPAAWADQHRALWEVDGIDIGYELFAAVDRDGWHASWSVSGAYFRITSAESPTAQMLVSVPWMGDECVLVDEYTYDDGTLSGPWAIYDDCGTEGGVFVVLAVGPSDGSFTFYVELVATTQADLGALDTIVPSIRVTGDLTP